MQENNKLTTFTYKDNREKSNNNSIVGVKEEDLVEIDDTYTPSNSMDAFKYSSAKQNEWVRMLFQRKKNIDQINKEIEVFVLRTNKPDSFEYNNDTRVYVNTRTKEMFGSESPLIKSIINNSDSGKYKVGVKSALDFAEYFTVEAQKDNKSPIDIIQKGGRLYTNDTLDSVNKIDFVGINEEEESLSGISLIQVKSKKPPLNDIELREWKKLELIHKDETETVESIQNAHKEYLKNIEKITQKQILEKTKIKTPEDEQRVLDKYGDSVYSIMFNLFLIQEAGKKNNSIDGIIKDDDITLTEQNWTDFAFFMEKESDFNAKIEEFCNTQIDELDLDIFKNWLDNKINFQNVDTKKSLYKKYKPNNIVSGRRFNSVIYYKENGGWGKMVIVLD